LPLHHKDYESHFTHKEAQTLRVNWPCQVSWENMERELKVKDSWHRVIFSAPSILFFCD
jgi:hypothetical protein